MKDENWSHEGTCSILRRHLLCSVPISGACGKCDLVMPDLIFTGNFSIKKSWQLIEKLEYNVD